MRRIATTLLLTIGFATAVDAQELTASLAVYGPLGVGDLDGDLPPSAELRVTLPLSRRFAIEPFLSVGSDRSAGLQGFYGAQIRHRIGPTTRDAVYAFATYGVAAYYSRYGSVAPVVGHFGVGLHQRLFRRLAFRPEVQLVTFHVVPIGGRFLAGLSANVGP